MLCFISVIGTNAILTPSEKIYSCLLFYTIFLNIEVVASCINIYLHMHFCTTYRNASLNAKSSENNFETPPNADIILDIVNVWWCRCVQIQCTYSATQGTSQAKYDSIAKWRKIVCFKNGVIVKLTRKYLSSDIFRIQQYSHIDVKVLCKNSGRCPTFM